MSFEAKILSIDSLSATSLILTNKSESKNHEHPDEDVSVYDSSIPESDNHTYRMKVLYGKIRNDVRKIINTLCKYKNVDIIAGAVCIDYVYLSVAIPPKISISDFMGYLKGKSTLMIYDRHPELQSKIDK